MKSQKYHFALLISLFLGLEVCAQCLSLPNAVEQQLNSSNKIIEGKIVSQQTFAAADGNIYTSNSIDVYRVFKGEVGFNIDVVTEGGVLGDWMQVVTPSAQMHVGEYGVLVVNDDLNRSLTSLASAFYSVDEKSGTVYGLKNVAHREVLYESIARATGTQTIELRRIPVDLLQANATQTSRAVPEISSVYPLAVTAGTQTVLTITGQGFGTEQGDGYVAFHNADDGGQSFVSLPTGPHYISWTDTQIEMYVPSSTLYNNTVAGTGSVRVVSGNGASAESAQEVSVEYAKSEVVYSNQLNSTMLVGMQSGGYVYKRNQQLAQFVGSSNMVDAAFEKWACNTGVNFALDNEILNMTDWAHDGNNLIGLSNPGQLPSYLLGKTVTTFSGCSTPNGLQWNLIEVDILLNRDIDWWIGDVAPTGNLYDLETAILHEIGHAHLLQHNNNLSSPMYFQLTEGAMRRDLYSPSIDGGNYVSTQAVEAPTTCGNESHQYFDFSTCNLSLINAVDDKIKNEILVFPNPFQDQITIAGEWKSGSLFSIFDAAGRMVLNGILNSNNQTISTSQLSKGVYVLEVRDEAKSHIQRLIKN
ncbi:MAG: T9SS type A sorting domain-containing protein [Flavobacteriales bacterium]|nr:T9SS type A sorting domain-containing protein [Flavobacteriales bacterium]